MAVMQQQNQPRAAGAIRSVRLTEWISDPEVEQQTIRQIESLEDKYSVIDIGSN